MNELFFTEKHLKLRESVKEFLMQELDPIKSDINQQNKVPISLIRKLGRKGFFGPLIPKNYGGIEEDLVSHCLMTEEISKLNVSVSVTRTPCILNGYLLNKYGSEFQKETFLRNIANADKLCAICLTEEEAGSNVAGIQSRAIKKGNKYVLNGSKKFITNAGLADYYFIWCITDPTVNPRNGISVFLLEKDFPGLIIENPYKLMGINGIYNGILRFDNIEISESNLIGEEGSGYHFLMDTFNIERITLSSECNGISIAALEESKSYANTRKQFGKRISSFQTIKLKIADMATQLRAARLLTYNAAKLHDLKLNVTKEASMAKVFSSKTALSIASEAVQIHGGNGYTDMFPIERYMRDARFFQVGGGTSEIQQLIIAREELRQN